MHKIYADWINLRNKILRISTMWLIHIQYSINDTFCVRNDYIILSRFKKKPRYMNINVSYLQIFFAMTKFFDKQYLENEWNDFINNNYVIDCENSILFSSLNYFVNHDILQFNSRLTIIFQNLLNKNSHADRVFISTCIDYINLQNSFENQNFNDRTKKMNSKYKKIKTLYKKHIIISTLLIII